MNLKKSLLLFICFMPLFTLAQEWEFGTKAGMMGYIGDLNTENPLKFNRPAIAFDVRYGFTPFSGLKLSIMQGSISADDANSSIASQRLRNLNFKSSITEVALLYDYYFWPFTPGVGRYKFTPYAFVGIAGFLFEPQTEYNGNTVNLRDLGTEGQGTVLNTEEKYSNFALSIPFGLGIKYNFANNFNIGVELGYRNTLTDYLDDVSGNYADKTQLATLSSQLASDLSDRSAEVNNGTSVAETFTMRGDNTRRDFYMFTGVTLTYTLTPIKCPDFKIFKYKKNR
jgi:opacity protein-like surface antigen